MRVMGRNTSEYLLYDSEVGSRFARPVAASRDQEGVAMRWVIKGGVTISTGTAKLPRPGS